MTILRSPAGIPDATVARLPLYLRALDELAERGTDVCSSEHLATAAGVNSAIVRKDLSHLGSYGTRGVGYDVRFLAGHIAAVVGQTQPWPVVIVGAGHLGSALAAYQGFGARGVKVAAVVDADPELIGTTVGGHEVLSIEDLPGIVERDAVSLGIIATPPAAAQSVADALVEAGISSILNFAPTALRVPAEVDLRQVDVAAELQILGYHAHRRQAGSTEEAVIS
ncbi:redox-sensing transcriptional repressor Rex [Aeromicrobium tamlense]|uniref:Redox-sensing transcriptional repressor Rex n=1 Tax=Aeromicrobium tamlense TaxID=375541 RepID=A0A8I0FV58_9ACTN|nr:redox-sensing transcriptional repressor Rex [Aeromicrobium tamlense]MBD1269380.1 redox-sensing transcriptional repressor Rex [Aeromicrobium tamlense]NYI36712.1 redox-sensing transcriptional repressor [Aeromicrobium tamlense]